jgi:hypothetical protein
MSDIKSIYFNKINNDLYNTYILNTVNELCPSKKKTIYSNEYYLKNIKFMLNDFCKWSSLSYLYNDKSKFHWKSIENKFRQWSKLNIFQEAYSKMLSDHILSENKSSSTIDLYIDSADISNINGSEETGYGKNKKKKQTKINFIGDINKNVYEVTFCEPRIPDVKTIITIVNLIKDKFKYRKVNLIGDKGYISAEIKKELKEENINLIYPHRKNMKPTPKRSKNKLKNRYIIEHTIRDNKKNNRIQIRKDRLIHTYRSFLFLSMIINLQKFINKNINQKSITESNDTSVQ